MLAQYFACELAPFIFVVPRFVRFFPSTFNNCPILSSFYSLLVAYASFTPVNFFFGSVGIAFIIDCNRGDFNLLRLKRLGF